MILTLRSKLRLLVGLLASAWLCGGASAGFSAAPTAGGSAESRAAGAAVFQPTLCGPGFSTLSGRLLPQCLLPGSFSDASLTGDPADGRSPAIVALPGAPSSTSLVVCGLVALGAVGGLRSLRKAHFGLLPEWYSTSGPQQIGHATPIDFDFPGLPIRPFEFVEPLAPKCNAVLLDLEISSQRERFTLASPRGPPSYPPV